MIKKLTCILFLLIPFFVFAQKDRIAVDTVSKVSANANIVQRFFSEKNISLDSAKAPYLYYKIYEWIGTCYKYSGETKKGIDCSGFVSEMYQNIYCINLTGGSGDIWTQVRPVEKTNLQEGDILFFKIRRGQISHVGVYLGNNYFAHASVHSGVIVSNLNEEYYKKYFFKGGRVTDEPTN